MEEIVKGLQIGCSCIIFVLAVSLLMHFVDIQEKSYCKVISYFSDEVIRSYK